MRTRDERPGVGVEPGDGNIDHGADVRGESGPGTYGEAARVRSPFEDDGEAGHQWNRSVLVEGRPENPDTEIESRQVADFLDIKSRVHRQLLDRLNLTDLDEADREEVVLAIREVVRELLLRDGIPLNLEERERLMDQVLDEIFGLGPLEPLVHDPNVSDILVNTFDQVYVERDGRLLKTPVRFKDDAHLLRVIDRIVSAVGRRIDDSSPMVDARLRDGSRVNAIIPPLAIDGPHLSIRKFRKDVLSAADILRTETITEPMLELLQGVVKARLNVLISGGTGAGKTTLLNVLSESIPHSERIVTIEDSAELQLRQPHVVRLETRSANIEGSGEINQRMLVINSLRMRPDRIVLGEVRGGEAVDMLQAMNTGHDGSLTTLHANSPRDALSRLETMISMAELNLPTHAMRQQISSALDVVIHLARLSDGRRRVLSIAEVVGMEGDVITMQDVFVFERHDVDDDGNVIGAFRATGVRPKFTERLRAYGVKVNPELFNNELR
jgi:pilus assembly protein CpaF